MAYFTNFFFEFYAVFTEDASLLFLWNCAKSQKWPKARDQKLILSKIQFLALKWCLTRNSVHGPGAWHWCPSSNRTRLHAWVYNCTTVESGKNVTFFEQLLCFYQLVLVVWNTLGAKFNLSFISWVEQNCQFLWQWSKKSLLTHLGGLWGKRGSGKNHFSARGFRGLARLASFYSISMPRVQFFSGVRHVCHDNDGSFADPGIPGYKHLGRLSTFSLPSDRLIF